MKFLIQLSEGPWIDKLSNKIKTIAGVKNAIPVYNGSGLVALLLILKNTLVEAR